MKKQTSVLRVILVSLLVTLTTSVVLGLKYIYYGSLTRTCIYTEKTLVVPENLASGVIEVSQPAYLASGNDKVYGCLPTVKELDGQVVGPEVINNISIGRDYFGKNGFTFSNLDVGRKFKVVGLLEVTKHGISTIDSGPGPIDFLILADENGRRYKIATVSLGLNKSDLFLIHVSSSTAQMLEHENFRTWDHEPFTFTKESLYDPSE